VSPPLRIALVLDPLSVSLVRQGLRVRWAGHAPELAREFLGRGYEVRGFGAPAGLIPRSSADGGPDDERAVGSRLRQFAPDVIVAYDALSPAALRGARMARVLGSTLVVVEARARGDAWKGRLLRRVGETLWGLYVRRTAAAVVAVDPLAERQAVRAGFSSEIVRVVPYGVDVQAFRPGLASTLVARQRIRGRILLYLGRLDEQRGVFELLSAFARTVGQRSDWSLVFAGRGPVRAELRAMADRLGMADRVHWVEPRDEELPGLLGASTALAIPARTDEVTGRHAARAMAAGLPILVSDLASLHPFVTPEENGLRVAPGSIEAWSEAIRHVAGAPNTRARWARRSRELAVERYSWPAVAARFEEIIAEARARVQAKLAGRLARGAYAGR
jgi:glycosyltransferase involved in cell wall biosynthesis